MNPKFEVKTNNSVFSQENQSQIVSVNTQTSSPVLAQTNFSSDFSWLLPVGIIAGSFVVILITLYILFAKFYRVCNTNEAFVVSGPTRDKDVITRSTLFFPGFETITIVSLNQVTVSVVRGNTAEKPLRTKDFLKAVFNGSLQVRVDPDENSIRNAAMLLGAGKKGEQEIIVGEEEIKKRVNDILEGHLRDAASQANLGELQGSVETVTNYLKTKVEPDLARYGLQLLNIAITNIDELNHYNPDNYLDIQAVVTRESIVQQNKKELEKVQEETKTEIAQLKLLETQKQLTAERDLRQKQLENAFEIEQMTAENQRQVLEVQETERAKEQILKVIKQQEVQEGSILSQKQIREKQIKQEQAIQEAEIAKGIAISQKNQELADAEKALIESRKAVALAETNKETAIKLAEEERQKELAKIKAQQQKETALITKQGELEQKRLEAENQKTMAIEQAEAIKIKAEAELEKALKEAEGEKAKIAAQNTLSVKALTVQLAEEHMDTLITTLPQMMTALAPQPGVLGNNPIILAGGQGADNGDPTKILLATSGLSLLTKLLQNPVVTKWSQQLYQSLDSDGHSQVRNHEVTDKAHEIPPKVKS
jgi:uncharacterized membrane protein YqiK